MVMNVSWTTPATPAQQLAIDMLEHEHRMLLALRQQIHASQVHDMDRRRIEEMLPLARDIQELRCAALRTIIVEEEQAKVRA